MVITWWVKNSERWSSLSVPPFAYHDVRRGLTEHHTLLKPCHVLKSCKFWLNIKSKALERHLVGQHLPKQYEGPFHHTDENQGCCSATSGCPKEPCPHEFPVHTANLETTASLCMNRTVPKPTVTESWRKAIACCQESPADRSISSGFVEASAASNSSLRGSTKKSFSLGHQVFLSPLSLSLCPGVTELSRLTSNWSFNLTRTQQRCAIQRPSLKNLSMFPWQLWMQAKVCGCKFTMVHTRTNSS